MIYQNISHHLSNTLYWIHFRCLYTALRRMLHTYLNPLLRGHFHLTDRQSYKVTHQVEESQIRGHTGSDRAFWNRKGAVSVFTTGTWKIDAVYFNSSESLSPFQKQTTST